MSALMTAHPGCSATMLSRMNDLGTRPPHNTHYIQRYDTRLVYCAISRHIILAVSLHISRSLYGPCRSPKEQKLVWNDLTLRARLESFMWRFIRVPRNSAVSVYVRADWIGQALLWYILPNTGVAVFGINS